MITIYHNPRCTKSREGVCLLEEKGLTFETIKYLDETLTKSELISIIEKLNIKPIELVRTKETVWKENFKDKELSDDEVIAIMLQNPILIERPIIINGDKAVIGRPTEKILEII
ncbi:arsenate reductase (glutaredoxin) [Flavobacterium cauense R2A-7]|uniref:Arsenate reductase n=1 Tax=Flavobacterium cauense R2A-7 TaxID=1341154 RepID=V6RW49_9FLAO|nr:arsenate reductase (glutaredoxin) [Flavobacterium cauense]ESU18711.1 arsenate reductase (glutaredoxin) [Flavobacterium cauense R2A-7]KGO81813.1 arsenate reductase [Flavobacterium cauense R2A-7]TWI13846.1 arsenate reductase [Flavobacterium cauense R2A-7]